MIGQIPGKKYSYFVNALLFLFVLFVNINNTMADIALFSLSMTGIYVLIKNNINPFKDSRLRLLLLITAGYYFINLVVFFINGTNFDKYIQTDLYFLLAVFVAAALLHAKVNTNLFFTGIRFALLFLGVCHFLSFDCSNIYISIFAPITVLMMFLSIINFDNDSLINKLLGLTAFIFGMIIVVDSGIRLSWLVFTILTIVVPFVMIKKTAVNKLSLIVSLLLLGVFISFITTNNTINSRINQAYDNISNWNSDNNLKSPVGLRLEMYKTVIENVKDVPFFGYGLRTSNIVLYGLSPPKFQAYILSFNHLHNAYLTNYFNGGVLLLGALLFLLFARKICGLRGNLLYLIIIAFQISFRCLRQKKKKKSD